MEQKESIPITPYTDTDIPVAMSRLILDPYSPKMIQSLFPAIPVQEFFTFASTLKTIQDFQSQIISPAITTLLNQTSKGLTISGLEHLSKDRKYLFISNHRDIICDPALLTYSLLKNGFQTPKICLGDNLLTHSIVLDLVKMNKGVTVKRDLTPRELLKASVILSDYIHQQIHSQSDSVWIAQREGRAKNGIDATQPGLLKMLTLSQVSSIAPLDRLIDLHIVPISISYEYDPCDVLKAQELVKRSHGDYQKEEDEDKKSMIQGAIGFKGRIHIEIGEELSEEISHLFNSGVNSGVNSGTSATGTKREQIQAVASLVDRKIQKNYRLWPTHWIASDLIRQGAESSASAFQENRAPAAQYTAAEKEEFTTRMKERLSKLEVTRDDRTEIALKFLESYANPTRVCALEPRPDTQIVTETHISLQPHLQYDTSPS